MDFLKDYIGEGIASFLTALITWLFSRRKQQADLKKNELDLVEYSLKIYREIISDLGDKVSVLTESNHQLTKIVESLKIRKAELIKSLNDCKNNIKQ